MYILPTWTHPFPPTQYYSTGIDTKIVILSPINGKVGKLFKKYAVDIEKHNKEEKKDNNDATWEVDQENPELVYKAEKDYKDIKIIGTPLIWN